MTEVGLWKYAAINPLTPEFSELPVGTEVEFLPLENIWSQGKADYSERKKLGADSSYTQFRSGDILVPKVTPTVFHGRSMIAQIEGEIGLATSEVHVIRAKNNADPRWLTYQMLTTRFLDEARGNVFGVAGLKRISTQYLTSYKVENTPLETQRRIADYLDKEISKMDTLIEDLEALVENLDKRRSPIIRAAFRRYDSVLMPLNLLAKFKTGSTPKDCREDENGLQWVKPDGLAVVSQGTRISEESSDQLPAIPRDSTLFCGIGATVGKVGYLNEPAVTNQQITSLIPVGGVSGKLIYYSLLAEADRIRATAPRSTLPIFNNARLGAEKILMCRPELNEKVLSELDREFERMDALIEESTRLIEYLKARKTTLITEVVTGRKEV